MSAKMATNGVRQPFTTANPAAVETSLVKSASEKCFWDWVSPVNS